MPTDYRDLPYRDRAVRLYNEERKVGWDPAWVNATRATREWYLEAARLEMEGEKDGSQGLLDP